MMSSEQMLRDALQFVITKYEMAKAGADAYDELLEAAVKAELAIDKTTGAVAVNEIKQDIDNYVRIANEQAQEIADLVKINQQLLEALQEIVNLNQYEHHIVGELNPRIMHGPFAKIAQAAIAAAEAANKGESA